MTGKRILAVLLAALTLTAAAPVAAGAAVRTPPPCVGCP